MFVFCGGLFSHASTKIHTTCAAPARGNLRITPECYFCHFQNALKGCRFAESFKLIFTSFTSRPSPLFHTLLSSPLIQQLLDRFFIFPSSFALLPFLFASPCITILSIRTSSCIVPFFFSFSFPFILFLF